MGNDDWRSGFLCTPCLRIRLGRDLTDDDYLCRVVRATAKHIEMQATPEYIERVVNGRGY